MSDLLSYNLSTLLSPQSQVENNSRPIPGLVPTVPRASPPLAQNLLPLSPSQKKEDVATNSLSGPSHVRSISGVTVMDHQRRKLFGKKISVVSLNGKEFLIGVQIAALLKRETFNMYRSMKIKQIELVRANPDQVEYFVRAGAVRSGTHSVTLVPFDDAVQFISEAQEKQQRTEAGNFSRMRKPIINKTSNSPPTTPTTHSFDRKPSPQSYSNGPHSSATMMAANALSSSSSFSSRVPTVASLLNGPEESLTSLKSSFDQQYSFQNEHRSNVSPQYVESISSTGSEYSSNTSSESDLDDEPRREVSSGRNRRFYRDDPLWTLLITAREVLL